MSKRDLHQLRVKQLLAQDPEINDTQMEEFRMQLDQTLELWEAKAKQTRRRILIALLVYMVVMLANFAVPSRWRNAAVDPQMIRLQEWILVPLGVSGIAVLVICVLLVMLYLFKYWPRLNRARFDVQTSMLLELQQQVKELQENFGRRQE